MTTTDVIFAAFLQCETKAHLLGEGVAGARSEADNLQQHLSNRYKQAAAEWLKSKIQKGDPYAGRPSSLIQEQDSFAIILEPLIESSELRAQPDALTKIPEVPRFDLLEPRSCRAPINYYWPSMLSPYIASPAGCRAVEN